MALGRSLVSAFLASGGDLPPIPAAGVFDCEPERRRLAVLRGSGKLGAVPARVEQDDYAREKPKGRYRRCRKLTR
jgi:hypothetical protein